MPANAVDQRVAVERSDRGRRSGAVEAHESSDRVGSQPVLILASVISNKQWGHNTQLRRASREIGHGQHFLPRAGELCWRCRDVAAVRAEGSRQLWGRERQAHALGEHGHAVDLEDLEDIGGRAQHVVRAAQAPHGDPDAVVDGCVREARSH